MFLILVRKRDEDGKYANFYLQSDGTLDREPAAALLLHSSKEAADTCNKIIQSGLLPDDSKEFRIGFADGHIRNDGRPLTVKRLATRLTLLLEEIKSTPAETLFPDGAETQKAFDRSQEQEAKVIKLLGKIEDALQQKLDSIDED